MITVYFSFFHSPLAENDYQNYLKLMPADIQTKICKYRNWEDAHAGLLARLLLLRAFEDFNVKADLTSVRTTIYGKPYVEHFNFNISHSDNIVLVGISDSGEIGIDVEKIREIEINEFRNIFCENEWKEITESSDKKKCFLKFWTQKECLIKANGKGLFIPLNQVLIKKYTGVIEDVQLFLREINVHPNYICYCATEKSDTALKLVQIDFAPY